MALIINGEKIEDEKIQHEAERLRPTYEQTFADMEPKKREAQLLDWSRENVIEQTLIAHEVEKRNITIPDAKVEAALAAVKKEHGSQQEFLQMLETEGEEKIEENIRLELRIMKMLDDVCKSVSDPDEEAITKYYEENKEQMRSVEQVRAAHIVKHPNGQVDDVAALAVMKEAKQKLNDGALFETLAAEYSDCPDNGGALGYFTREQMVEEFNDVVFNLGIGQISDIFHTRFGYHIAKVYDRVPAAIPPLAKVRDGIINTLKEELNKETIDDFVDDLKSKAVIEDK